MSQVRSLIGGILLEAMDERHDRMARVAELSKPVDCFAAPVPITSAVGVVPAGPWAWHDPVTATH